MDNKGGEGGDSLKAVFQRLISNYGPITLQHFMGESNARYYAGKDPLGSAGDFVTAPEISQMFGELIGLWLADIWIRAGRDADAQYVELGPGRGTLAKDALRAMKRYGLEPRVHFVESSTTLKDLQIGAVPQAQLHADLSSVPMDGPLLVVGNEFLDALPVRQLVRMADGWRERMVDFQDGRFLPVAGTKPMDAAVPAELQASPEGTLIETCPGASAVVYELAGRLVDQGGAALLIDYGHDHARTGSTLQALKAHTRVDPFAMPGEADLTCHVDFAALANVALSRGARHLGTVTQGRFLRDLGIDARAEALARIAPQHAQALQVAKDRLIEEGQMGALFKVMGLTSQDWPDGASF